MQVEFASPSILLRVLLCLALVFNGVTDARAAMLPHAAMMAGDAGSFHALTSKAVARDAAGDGVDEATASMPCHGRDASISTAAVDADATTPDDEVPSAPDCCEASCQCTCIQQATVMPVLMSFVASGMQALVRRDGLHAHVPPVPLRLNRPPII